MALTPSNMLALGTKAPSFELPNTINDTIVSLESSKGSNATVIMFICNHCPFVKHVNTEISELAKDYISKGIKCIAISSNDANKYPEDAPQLMKQNAIENDFIFPYLYDESQDAAKAYDAACTPDFYVFDSQLKLVYRGQLDDSRPGNGIPVSGKDIRNVLDSLLNDQDIMEMQMPSIGCNIKWKQD